MSGRPSVPRGGVRGLWRSVRRSAAHRPSAAWMVAIAAAAVVLFVVAAPLEAVVYRVPVPWALLLAAVQSAALVGSVRLSLAAVLAFAGAGAALRVVAAPPSAPWPWAVTGIIAFALLVAIVWAAHGWRLGAIAFLVPGIVVSGMALFDDAPQASADTIVALSIGAGGAVVGALLSERVRIAGQLEREREAGAEELQRRLLAEERQRIARELHDVVAHGLSLIQVQATSARYRIRGLPDEAVSEFDDIARASRSSLAEMRRLLGVLRGDDDAARAPQPGVHDIPRLVAETERAGARIRLRLDAPDDAAPAAGIAAYRIVQEAISNAVRHAPGAAIDVAVATDGDALRVEVSNEEPADPPPSRGVAGHGLVGMRERAALLGGSLQSGPTAGGGYRVVARLPLTPPEVP